MDWLKKIPPEALEQFALAIGREVGARVGRQLGAAFGSSLGEAASGMAVQSLGYGMGKNEPASSDLLEDLVRRLGVDLNAPGRCPPDLNLNQPGRCPPEINLDQPGRCPPAIDLNQPGRCPPGIETSPQLELLITVILERLEQRLRARTDVSGAASPEILESFKVGPQEKP